MKKIYLFFALVGILTGANAQNNDRNQIIFDEEANQDIIYGYCDLDGLTAEPFNEWFDAGYDTYTVNKEALSGLSEDLLSEIEICIVMGTWCSDSQREVPHFFKIADYLDLDLDMITVIGVNRNKEAKDTDVSELNIELVPTFIFKKDGEEIGRIIESPEESLEQDMANIILHN